jgi:ADP-ribose pyrophosphatase YjhB (NUDIX family)
VHLEVVGGAEAFKIRAAALIVRDGRVLLNRLRGDPAWMLPGGTGEFGETVEETLRRELREDLGVDARVGRLLWLVEHFFDLGARRWHQLLWVHEAALPEDCGILRAETMETPSAEGSDHFRWTTFDELPRIRVLPGFLAEGLRDLPTSPTRVVREDYLR